MLAAWRDPRTPDHRLAGAGRHGPPAAPPADGRAQGARPSTVGMLAERTDQAAANVSHHLKVLAAADLVTEAPELARDRRERWWRLRTRACAGPAPTSTPTRPARAVADAADLAQPGPARRAWPGPGTPPTRPRRPPGTTPPFSTDHWLHLTPGGAGRARPRDDRPARALGQTGRARRRAAPRAGLRVRPRRPGAAVTADRRRATAPRARGRRRPPAGCCGTATSGCSGPARRSAAVGSNITTVAAAAGRGRRARRQHLPGGGAHRRGLAALAAGRPAGRRVGGPAAAPPGDDRLRPALAPLLFAQRAGGRLAGLLTIGHLLVVALGAGLARVFFETADQVYLPALLRPSSCPSGNARLHGRADREQSPGPASPDWSPSSSAR